MRFLAGAALVVVALAAAVVVAGVNTVARQTWPSF